MTLNEEELETLLHSPPSRICEKEDIWIFVLIKRSYGLTRNLLLCSVDNRRIQNNLNHKFLHNTSNKRTKRGSDFCCQSNSVGPLRIWVIKISIWRFCVCFRFFTPIPCVSCG